MNIRKVSRSSWQKKCALSSLEIPKPEAKQVEVFGNKTEMKDSKPNANEGKIGIILMQ